MNRDKLANPQLVGEHMGQGRASCEGQRWAYLPDNTYGHNGAQKLSALLYVPGSGGGSEFAAGPRDVPDR